MYNKKSSHRDSGNNSGDGDGGSGDRRNIGIADNEKKNEKDEVIFFSRIIFVCFILFHFMHIEYVHRNGRICNIYFDLSANTETNEMHTLFDGSEQQTILLAILSHKVTLYKRECDFDLWVCVCV